MTSVIESVANTIAPILVNKINKEVKYFRDFDDHVHNFEIEHNSLVAKRDKMRKDIEECRRNGNEIEDDVQNWIKEVDIVIQEHIKIKQTWSYGWCPYWQYRQGKMLAQRMMTIKTCIDKCNFERLARPTEFPSIEYHASREFIDFESRKTKFQQLVEALEDESHYMIGLQGMGGTGKTTLATQVGKQLEESKAFEKVIFVVVSNPPDVNKIRGDIARPLGMHLEEHVEAEHSQRLWSRISKERKLLIILDDVWEELNLIDIGIPSGPDHKNCFVLITTRHSKVCQDMRCQQVVHLHTLANEDGLKLFKFHATSDNDYSSSTNLDGLAQSFIKECGGLPVAIVALARTLRSWPVNEWNVALTTLQTSMQFVDVDEELVKVYKCLRLSYDNLNDEKAQKLFLLCSVFPEDYEIPISLFIRLGIGSGIFDEVHEYCVARSQALRVKNNLTSSSLLLNVEKKKCVKMHDLVREVAQWIAKEDIEEITNSSRVTLKENYKRFVFWSANDFPDQVDGSKLEILLLWISGNVLVKDPNAFFAGMIRLKFLFLLGEYDRKVPPSSLSQSLLSLKSIQTLILDGWEIGDISVLKNLQSVMTLEFKNCLIFELPRNIMELKNLRWLGLRKCEIQKNNPFEVIEKCSQLKELDFVGNHNVKDWKLENDEEIKEAIAHDISPLQLQMYSIACSGFKRFADDGNGLLTCFNPENMKHLLSEAMFKYLVGRAQVLELGRLGQTRWKSLIPDIIPMEDGGMNNLIKLYLYKWAGIECLIDNSNHRYSNVRVFSELLELHLYGMDVEEIYRDAMPFDFLKKLQVLKLSNCMKLQSILLDENLKLPHLKVLEVGGCPMFQPSIFRPSFARSLVRLEKLVIERCKELQSLIADETLEEQMTVVGSQKNQDILFQELKSLEMRGCDKLEMVSPLLLSGDLPKLEHLYIKDCEKLKCIFVEYRDVGQVLQGEVMLPSLTKVKLEGVPNFINIFKKCKKRMPRPPHILKEDSREKYETPKTSAFSRAFGCCFMSPTKDTNIGVYNATLEDHQMSQESCGSSKVIEIFQTTDCLMRQPLSLHNLKEMILEKCSELKSLFSVSIASTIMLEKLEISHCDELKLIITNEKDCTSIFPELQSLKVYYCDKLDFIFPSSFSGGLQKLKSIDIFQAEGLKYIFGKFDDATKCISNENENDALHIHLPSLESLDLNDVPNMISIGINKYKLECPSLHTVEAPKEIEKKMQDLASEGGKESEIQEVVNVETQLTPIVAFQYFLNFHNLKKITIWGNKKLNTLFSISACRSLPHLSKLSIWEYEELVNVVEDDSFDHHHVNSSSIFPKLEGLLFVGCNKLEFIFPFSPIGSLQKLKSLIIRNAVELKYIFAKHAGGDYISNENESDADFHIHLPALEHLVFVNVPKMINNIRAEEYQLSFPRLRSIDLADIEEFNGGSFPDLLAYLHVNVKVPKDLMQIIKDVQKLTYLKVRNVKIEEVLNFEGVEIGGQVSLRRMELEHLSEFRYLWKGPKNMLNLHNLHELFIKACKKLKVIFYASMVKSLPQLICLWLEDCDELVDIIEESDEDHSHGLCFPNLGQIHIDGCNSLKYLFSNLTCGMFAKLHLLQIANASELEQAFILKQDDAQKMATREEVFPKMSRVELIQLPKFATICKGIDFEPLKKYSRVYDCPKYQEANQIQQGPVNGDSESQPAASALPDFAESSKEAMNTSVEEAASSSDHKETGKEDDRVVHDPASKFLGPTSSSFQITETIKVVAESSFEENYTTEDTTRPFVNSKNDSAQSSKEAMKPIVDGVVTSMINQSIKEAAESSHQENYATDDAAQELKDEQSTCEVASLGQLQDLGETNMSAEVSHKTKIPFDDDSIDVIVKERVQESPSSKDVMLETMLADLAPSNLFAASITTPQEDQFPLDMTKKETRIGTIMMTNQQVHAEKTYVGARIIQEDATTMTTEIDTFFIYPQAEGSQSGPSTMSTENIQEETTTMKSEIDVSSFSSHVEVSQSDPSKMIASMEEIVKQDFQNNDTSNKDEVVIQSTNPELMKQPISGSLAMPSGKEFSQTTNETRAAKVQDFKPNIPMEANTSIRNVIPSSHHQSKPGAASSSSLLLEIGEIFQLVELKEGEPALLAKALELYPQLRLSREQRTYPIIAFSYRILVDILVMLATKTPHTITTSDLTTLEANLGAATFLGFDKDWIESVRAKVFGIDKADVLVAEEKISVMEEELEAVDTQLFDLLENRRNLVMKMVGFRKVINVKDRPFGI